EDVVGRASGEIGGGPGVDQLGERAGFRGCSADGDRDDALAERLRDRQRAAQTLLVGDHRPRLRVGEGTRELVPLRLRIEQQGAGAQRRQGEQADRVLDAVRQQQDHHVAALDAVRGEPARESCAPVGELREGQPLIAADDRGPAAEVPSIPFEQRREHASGLRLGLRLDEAGQVVDGTEVLRGQLLVADLEAEALLQVGDQLENAGRVDDPAVEEVVVGRQRLPVAVRDQLRADESFEFRPQVHVDLSTVAASESTARSQRRVSVTGCKAPRTSDAARGPRSRGLDRLAGWCISVDRTRMRLIDALNTLNAARGRPDRVEFDLLCGFQPLHLATLLGARLQQVEPRARVHIREGRYGDLAGNLERAAQAPCRGAAVVVEWDDLDPRLGIRHAGSWSHDRLADVLDNAERSLARLESALAALVDSEPVALCLPTLPLPPVALTPTWQASPLGTALAEC